MSRREGERSPLGITRFSKKQVARTTSCRSPGCRKNLHKGPTLGISGGSKELASPAGPAKAPAVTALLPNLDFLSFLRVSYHLKGFFEGFLSFFEGFLSFFKVVLFLLRLFEGVL